MAKRLMSRQPTKRAKRIEQLPPIRAQNALEGRAKALMDVTDDVIEMDEEELAGDPFRPIDWRWRLAEQRFRVGRRGEPADDLVGQATDYLRRRRRRPNSAAKYHPEIAVAQSLRLSEQAMLRWEIEARILAYEPDEEIAGRCGLSAGAVGAYRGLHFDVQDRLDKLFWLPGNPMEPDLPAHPNAKFGRLMKQVAFRAGPAALDQLLASYVRPALAPPRSVHELITMDDHVAERYLTWRKLALVNALSRHPGDPQS
jgi:hypothetical protein